MKPILLVVEDNQDVLLNLKILLEYAGYEVITAENGQDALETLSKLSKIPDLILSDISMPKMDGYEFFENISEYPSWNTIPFIFLTALGSAKDIRLGKMLGVDDYIVKPFKEEDLLASVAGKIARNKKTESINQKIEKLFQSLQIETLPSIPSTEKQSVILLYCKWHDKLGPALDLYFPPETGLPIKPDTLGYQLFNGVSSIYGQDQITEAQGLLFKIENIQRTAYCYFDAVQRTETRGNQTPFMLAVVTPAINYFESLKIKKILEEWASKIKDGVTWDIKTYWDSISEVLTIPLL